MSNIKVAVRVRPLSQREIDNNARSIVEVAGDTVSVTNVKVENLPEYGDSRERVKQFTFDFCYDSTLSPQRHEYASQQLVFQDLGTEVLQAAFEGYNACVFAYGQTSTGKTYTMMGSLDDLGLIPRISEGLFSHVDDFEGENVTFRLDVSYFEIYNERVRDLLRPSLMRGGDGYTLKVREHPKEGTYVQDLSSHCVKDNTGIQELIDRGNENRTTAATYMHDHSSRSHAIFTIVFTQAKLEDDLPHEIVSKIHLVDLAGSERADPNYSPNYKGRLKEGSNINKSLVTLGNVIKALAERSLLSWSTDNLGSTQSFQSSSAGGDSGSSPFSSPKRTRLPYIPYRDSVLTWLLKDSLGGNSKTIMISTVTPASQYYNETISTLRYAQRAKSIINKPKINEDQQPFVVYDPNVTLIRELRREIICLRELLKNAQMGPYQISDINSVETHDIQVETDKGIGTSVGTTLAAQLHDTEVMANKLTQTWMDKWLETHDIMKESDLSIRGLKHKANSMGIMIESQMPHLIGMDDDILSTGVTIYHLKEGKTLVGREDAERQQDIVLSGPSVHREHCFIKNHYGTVTIYPNRDAQITINGLECKVPTRLKQGDYLLLGKTNMFRFNNPKEAEKLRQRRESAQGSEEILTVTSSSESLDREDLDSYSQRIHPFHPVYGPNLQLERQYQSESERINQAKKELETLREEHSKAEEAVKEKEEEIWRTHEVHRGEIEEQKRKVAQMMEEVGKQREQAEAELEYARECLQKEREAFYNQLQSEVSSIKQGDQTHHPAQTDSIDSDEALTEHTTLSKPDLDVVHSRQMSVEGRMKDLAQGELIKTLHHRETEESIRRQSEDLEDYFHQSKQEIQKQLGKIQEIEQEYRTEDAEHYKEMHEKESVIEEIQKREEQLQLYIEEKQNLLMVESFQPQPLRTACSEEVLTMEQVKDVGFPVRTTSLKALYRGSEGDLPTMSHRLSTLHCDRSDDSLLSESCESMDYSTTSTKGEEGGARRKNNVSAAAKSVTDRLYKAPAPKFKYEPKSRSPKPESAKFQREARQAKSTRKPGDNDNDDKKGDLARRRGVAVGRGVSPRSSPARTISPAAKSTLSPRASPARSVSATKSTISSRISPVRATSPAAKVAKKVPSEQKSRTASTRGNQPVSVLKKKENNTLHLSKSSPQISVNEEQTRRLSPKSLSPTSPDKDFLYPERALSPNVSSTRTRRLSPTSGLSPEHGSTGSGRVFVPRLRHVTSATSLVSVPEAILEEVEPLEQSTVQSVPNIPQVVVRRRKKRQQTEEDEFRRHSEPMGEELADAFEKYTQEIGETLERERSGMRYTERLSKDILLATDDHISGSNDNENDIPSDMDASEVRQVGSESDSLLEINNVEFMPGLPVLGNSDTEKAESRSVGCDEGGRAQEVECRQGMPVSMVNNDSVMVCSVSSAASDTGSIASDASTVIENDVRDEDTMEGEVPVFDNFLKEGKDVNLSVKVGSKRDGSVSETTIPAKTVKTESSGSSPEANIIIANNVQRTHETGAEGYSSDSLDEGDNSLDSLEKSRSPKGSLGEGDGFSDSLEESDNDLQQSGTLSGTLTSQTTLGDSYSTDLLSSMDKPKEVTDVVFSDQSEEERNAPLYVGSQDTTHASAEGNKEEKSIFKESGISNASCISDKQRAGTPDDCKPQSQGDKGSKCEMKIQRNEDNPVICLKENVENESMSAPKTLSESEVSVEKTPKRRRPRPSTRTLGVSTSPDLMPPELLEIRDDDVGSQASHDSLQEVQEQLMELEEALEKESQENQKGSGSNGTQISSARKATRQRAMIRQKQRGGSGESDVTDQISDDSFAAGNQQKTSSRPGSASRRRRRAQLKPAERKSKRLRGLSSEECNSTDSDGIRSASTLSDEEDDLPGDVSQDRAGNKHRDEEVDGDEKLLRDSPICGKDGEDYSDNELDDYCAELQRIDELDQSDSEGNVDGINERTMESGKMNGSIRRNRYVLPEHQGACLQNGPEKHRVDTYSVDSQYESTEERPGSRTPSETRDVGQQTDVSSVDSPLLSPFSPLSSFRSPSSTSTQTESCRSRTNMSISPVSVWNSLEKEVKSPKHYSSSHGLTTHHDKKVHKPKSKPKTGTLGMGTTDVWSSECYDANKERRGRESMYDSSESEDDGAYSMEAETISPQTPASSDRHTEHGKFTFDDDRTARSTPVRYEVTIKEEATNVLYNLDRTEIRTYGLPVNYDNVVLPDSINITLSDIRTHSTENHREVITSSHTSFQRPNEQPSSRDSAIVLETNYRCVRDMEVSDSGTDRESSVDRKVVDNQQSSVIENGHAENSPSDQHKSEFVHSPRESDTTSDYGTMVGDGRRCNTSFLIDSGSEGDLHDQTGANNTQGTNQNPEDIPPHYFRLGEQGISQTNEEGVDAILPTGQDICKSDTARRKRGVAPSSASLSREPEHISNLVTNDYVDGASQPIDVLRNLIEADSVPSAEDSTKENHADVTQVTNPDNELRATSDGPHLETRGEPTGKETTETSNKQAVDSQEIKEKFLDAETVALLSPCLKTVSVNTDQQLKLAPGKQDENSLREILKRELQQKIARLQRNSRSDSAISSDYTDGDSTSVSPRASRLYDSDKTLRSGILGSLYNDLPPGTNIEVMTTQTSTTHDQSESLPSQTKALDIDNKSVRKSPFKDSGNICDDDVTGSENESNETTFAKINNKQDEISDDLMTDGIGSRENIEDDSTTESEQSTEEDTRERSLSPGEVMLEYVFADKLKASREKQVCGEEVQWNEDENETEDRRQKEKSPSMPDLHRESDKVDFRRSMSENCIDQYEESSDNEGYNASSNDSIVFVFMGNSHSKDSMEQLKSFTSRQPGYKVDLESSQELLEASGSQENDRGDPDSGSIRTAENVSPSPRSSVRLGSSETLKQDGEHTASANDEDKPLRHRFGIDESILPIPTRSVSCDNLPKKSLVDKNIHRSRSASLLDVEQIENANDPKNNEGVFPPCVEASERDSNENSVIERELGSFETSNQSSFSSIENGTVVTYDIPDDVTYSRIPLGSSPSEQTFEVEESMPFQIQPGLEAMDQRKPQEQRYRAPVLVDRGMVTSDEAIFTANLLGPKETVTEACTQTQDDNVEEIEPKASAQQTRVLPSLDSPYRARSIGDVSTATRNPELPISQGTDDWYNLSTMVKETQTMIQNIHDGTSPPSENTLKGAEAKQTFTKSDTETRDDVTQTGSSLLDLHTSECQTEDDSMDSSFRFNVSTDGTQTDPACLEIAEVETTDILPVEMGYENSDQPSTANDFRFYSHRESETVESPIHPDKVENVEQPFHTETVSTTENSDYTTEYHKEHKESRKRDSTNETVIVEREYVYETEFEYPDIEASNAEMDALKVEHEKMMETIRKAADDRKSRVEKLRARMHNQEGRPVYNVDAKDRYKLHASNDTYDDYDSVVTVVKEEVKSSKTEPENDEGKLTLSDRGVSSSTTIHNYSIEKTKELNTAPNRNDNAESMSLQSDGHDEHIDKHKRYEFIYVDTFIQSSDSDGDGVLEERNENKSSTVKTVLEREPVTKHQRQISRSSFNKENLSAEQGRRSEVMTDQKPLENDETIERELVRPIQAVLQEKHVTESQNLKRDIPDSKLDSNRSYLPVNGERKSTMPSSFENKDTDSSTEMLKLRSRDLRGDESRNLAMAKDVVEDVLSDEESLKTPPNSPTPETAITSRIGNLRMSPCLDKNEFTHKLSELTKDEVPEKHIMRQTDRGFDRTSKIPPKDQHDRTFNTEKHETVSTGVEAAVDISDDFTQTDLILDLSGLEKAEKENVQTVSTGADARGIKDELDRLQRERVQIIDLLSLNFLPASLTVELLEAKLNYCIGQTDLLLQSLEENWDDYETIPSEYSHLIHTHITKEYLTKYRHDLQQSKSDIEICKEKMDRNQGAGRGRSKGRNRDILRIRRQAEVDAFRAERSREQQNYDRLRNFSSLKHLDSDGRSPRSLSPASSYTPRHKTPKQLKDYLLEERKQIVSRTLREQYNEDRLSRSCSPRVKREDQRLYSSSPISPRSEHTSYASKAPHRISHSHDAHLSYSPRVAFSATDELPADVDYGYSTYLVPPRSNIHRDYSPINRPRNSTLLSPTPLSSRYGTSPGTRCRSLSPGYMKERMEQSRPMYAHEESRSLLKEMEETREQNRREISRAHNTLESYKRYSDRGTSSESRREETAVHDRSYSSYTDYASDVLNNSYQSINGIMSGSYELYDDEVSRLTSRHSNRRSLSPTSSVTSSELDSHYDSVHSGTFNPFRIRPVRSSDIKSRLHGMRHRTKKS